MKYKVGDKVKTKGNEWFNKGEIVKIVEVDSYSIPYLCKGKTKSAWQCESDLEPLDTPITFQQKLDRFKREPIGFLVKSKEIADELAKVFEREGMESCTGKTAEEFMEVAWGDCGIDCNLYVAYNFPKRENGLSYGMSDLSGEKLDELLDITLEELKSYNASTLEDKLALFKAGTHVLHTPTQETYDKLMVELDKRGYVWHYSTSLEVRQLYWSDYNGNTILCCGFFGDGRVTYGKLGGRANEERAVLELTPEDFSTPQVITITSDGYHRTTAESNGVTAETLCNPTDTFDISKGSHIALKRLLEKLDEDIIEELGDLSGEPEGFHAGDIVEVVDADGYKFFDKVKGIQGIIVSHYNKNACEVKFPFVVSKKDTWYYHTLALKLVRKYNA